MQNLILRSYLASNQFQNSSTEVERAMHRCGPDEAGDDEVILEKGEFGASLQ
jgi:hypothetical protein